MVSPFADATSIGHHGPFFDLRVIDGSGRNLADANSKTALSKDQEIAGLREALSWAMDEIDTLSNKLCQFAYPQGMVMLNRAEQLPNYEAACTARRSALSQNIGKNEGEA